MNKILVIVLLHKVALLSNFGSLNEEVSSTFKHILQQSEKCLHFIDNLPKKHHIGVIKMNIW